MVHDYSDGNTVAKAIHENYEEKAIMKFNEDAKKEPVAQNQHSFICNEKQMDYLRTR